MKCEVCGGNVRVEGNTTKHYVNLDEIYLKQLEENYDKLTDICRRWESWNQELKIQVEDLESSEAKLKIEIAKVNEKYNNFVTTSRQVEKIVEKIKKSQIEMGQTKLVSPKGKSEES